MKQENPQNNLVILQGTTKKHKIRSFLLPCDNFTSSILEKLNRKSFIINANVLYINILILLL